MSTGKKVRLTRLFYSGSKQGLIIPMDHGLTLGAIPGLRSLTDLKRWMGHRAMTGATLHKGMAERLGDAGLLKGIGIMIHLNGMSAIGPTPDAKEIVGSVETAVRLGADAISVQVNFDGQNDGHNLKMLGQIVDEAAGFGLPVLSMVYDKVKTDSTQKQVERLSHLLRINVELGIDLLKTSAPAEFEAMEEIVGSVAPFAPVFFAGGPLTEESELLELATKAKRAGAAGLCAGRHILQSQNPGHLLDQLKEIVTRPALSPFYINKELENVG